MSSDLAEWDVHGPVHVLRREVAEWDASLGQWQPARKFNSAWFHPDGRPRETEHYNPDGSVFRSNYEYDGSDRLREVRSVTNDDPAGARVYNYDDRGRLSSIVSVDRDGAGHKSQAIRYGEDGKTTKVYYIPKMPPGFAYGYGYDDLGKPDEVVYYDGSDRLLRRIIITRDNAGRVIQEEMHSYEQPFSFPAAGAEVENAPPEVREAAEALFREMFDPERIFYSKTNTYDEKGRLLEQSTSMAQLSDERTIYRYDDRDNRIEQVMESRTRQLGIDDNGARQLTEEKTSAYTTRLEYVYDEHGNWTEQIVSSLWEPNTEFQRTNVEWRQITYY